MNLLIAVLMVVVLGVIPGAVIGRTIRRTLNGGDKKPLPPVRIDRSCPYCGGTGYAGRTAVYEMLPVDAAAREALMAGRPPVISDSALTLRGDGLRKVLEGETTLDEIADVIDNELLT